MAKLKIAEKIIPFIENSFPKQWSGHIIGMDNREVRIQIESTIARYGGKLIYSDIFAGAESESLMGLVEYVFYDGSVVEVKGLSLSLRNTPYGDVQRGLERFSSFELAKYRAACWNL